MAKKKANKQTVIGLAATGEDLKLIAELRAFYQPTMGVVTNAQVIRMGLRKLAESEGLIDGSARQAEGLR